jgi:hypothetical protein
MSKQTETPQAGGLVSLSRRRFMKSTAATLAAAGIIPAIALDRGLAQGKTSKADAAYQDSPKDSQQCSGCVHFIAGENQCRIVEGDISPSGWCRLFTASG